MNDLKLCVWISFVDVVKNYLGNRRAENSKELMEKLLKNLQDMSIKVHFLHRYLDKSPDNCGNMCDEQREWFYSDIKTIEERYKERWGERMMADYRWSIKRDINNIEHGMQSRKKKNYHSS